MRLAEVYLTRSILRLKAGDSSGALEDLNKIRLRAGLQEVSEINEEIIDKERLKELAFEGDHFFYLQALNQAIGAGDRENVAPIQPPYEGLYWQIPQLELDMNNQNAD